jgi:hypothetical protein
LRLAIVFRNVLAARAPLATASWWTRNIDSAPPRRFILKLTIYFPDALSKDGPVESRLLLHALAGSVHRAPGRLRHILDAQVISVHNPVVFGDGVRERMPMIPSDIGYSAVYLFDAGL